MPLINPRLIKTKLHAEPIPPAHVEILHAWRESIDNKTIFKQNETSLDGRFIQKILIDLLGYSDDLTNNRTLWKNKPVGSGNVDVALGDFSAGKDLILAPLELKGAKTKDLDAIMPGRHKSPVQQAWEYAMDAPGAQWVLVSNYLEIRLYAVGYGRQQYETWDLTRLTEPLEYARFQWLLNAKQLLSGATRAILEQSAQLETEITNKLYSDYKRVREHLLQDLPAANPQVLPLDLIRLSQTILDRILFIAFAEDRGLLPDKTIGHAFKQHNPYAPQSIWDNFKGLFRAIDSGNPALKIPAYNGGLFATDPALESLVVSDAICEGFKRLADYDFATEVSVTVLGHIFEQSISDIEDLQAQARGEQSGGGVSKRKQHGVVYTPDYITNFIVEHTLGKHLRVQFTALWEKTAAQRRGGVWKNREQETEFWRTYQQMLLATRVLDPACGSGAFLVAAFDRLHEEYQRVNSVLADLTGGSYGVFDLDKEILNRNLYGVDVNAESIEITKLSLWLKTAKRGKVLNDLQDTIQVGNSLIDDPAYTDKPFVWAQFAVKNPTPQPPPLDRRGGVKHPTPALLLTGEEEEKNPSDRVAVSSHLSCQGEGVGGGVAVSSPLSCQGEGGQGGGVDFGFDVILGNPPYVRQELLSPIKPYLQQHYKVYNGVTNLYTYFFELGLNLLKPGGRMGYISSSTLFKTGSGENLRRLLVENVSLETVVDFTDLQIFAGVAVCVSILTMQKAAANPEHCLSTLVLDQSVPTDLGKHFTTHATTMLQVNLDLAAWRFENAALVTVRNKITAGKPTLKQVYGSPLYGIKTGLNEAFVINQATRDALILADPCSIDVLKPLLTGKDIKNWHLEPRNIWLIFARQGTDMAKYPAVLNYLEQFRKNLEPKPKDWPRNKTWSGRASGNYKWYELQSTVAYYRDFEQQKLVYAHFQAKPSFALEKKCYYANDKCYILPSAGFYELGLLNSNLYWFLIKSICPFVIGSSYELRITYIQTLPIPHATDVQKLTIATLAEQCQTVAGQRYAKQQAVRQRLPDLAPQGTTPKLTTKLHDWWLLDFPQFRQEIKKCFKQDIPLADRNDWEIWLTKERTAIDHLTAQLKTLEQELNTQVYQLFDLTEEEIKLVEQ